MKKLLLLSTLAAVNFCATAQYTVYTIQEIQERSQTSLGNCEDESTYFGDTVIVRGKVVMNGALEQLNSAKQVWLQSGNGGVWSGIDVYDPIANGTTVNVDNLLAGDSVEIVGVVDEYQGETELIPIGQNAVTILAASQPIYSTIVSVGDLNDTEQNNNLSSGEQWEGAFVEIQNVSVVSLDYFSSGSRVSILVQDQFGNLINIGDRFLAQRLTASGGTFVAPNVGDQFQSIKGIVLHSKNNCAGSSGRGYEIHPFDSTHYVYGAAAPQISQVEQSLIVPNSSETVDITAEITDVDGTVIDADLYYAIGESGGTFNNINMTNTSGSTYEATIPAQANGTYVRWYITAEDNDNQVSFYPNSVPANNTRFYKVIDGDLTIKDVQYPLYSNGNSGYRDIEVTVQGVVTATINTTGDGDLGHIFIQQEGENEYAGLWLMDATNLSGLSRGDKIQVTGKIVENFGMTAMDKITTAPTTIGTGIITPTEVVPDSFGLYELEEEKYESMLLTYKHPTTGQNLYVTQKNADGTAPFGEYRIGMDALDSLSGSRILAGRSSATSSLYVSFVNDSSFAANMNVRPYIVGLGNPLTSVTGILYYSFSNWKLLPRNNSDFVGYSGPVKASFSNDLKDNCARAFEEINFTNLSSVIADDLDWDFGDGSVGATGENVAHTYSETGTFAVTLVAKNSADQLSGTFIDSILVVDAEGGDCTLGTYSPSGINHEFLVFPNPTNNVLNIEGPNMGHYSLELIDIQGRTVLSKTNRNGLIVLDLSRFESGIYILQIGSAGYNTEVHKIILN